MAELIIQYRNKAGDKIYPVTLATAVIDSAGENIDNRLIKASNDVAALNEVVKNNLIEVEYLKKSLSIVEKSVDLVQDSIQSIGVIVEAVEIRMTKVEESNSAAIIKVNSFDGRMTAIEENTSYALTKVEEFGVIVEDVTEKVKILNSDSSIEGSVDNKINTALSWRVL